MKRILYGISGIGNGHSNREMPIIEELAKDCQIMIFAHYDSLRVMTNRFGNNPNVTIVPVGLTFIVGSPTGLNFEATAKSAMNQNIKPFKTSFEALDKVITKWGKADLVITDYEPISAQYAYAYDVPLVTIDQQSKFLYGDLPSKLGGFTYTDEVARLSMFFPKVSKRIACSFFKVSPREGAAEVMLVPPTIKQSIIDLAEKRKVEGNKVNILLYVSPVKEFTQTPREIVDCLKQNDKAIFHLFVPKSDFEEYNKLRSENINIYPHGDPNFLKVMAIANGIISSAGHSLLSEAMFLSIPVYAIPVEPYEQHLNAWEIGNNGFGVSAQNLNNIDLEVFLNNLDIYTKNIKEDTRILNRGIGQEIIIDYLRKNFLTDKKKVLVFSPPFDGHLNIIKEFIKDNNKYFDFQIVITGWKNVVPDLTGIDRKIVKIIDKFDLHETDPALWTFPRVNDLLEKCVETAKAFKPDLIIYDFFSLEGNLVGRILNIPYWCSIPAMIGPFLNADYRDKKYDEKVNMEALENIKNKFGIRITRDDVEMVSDGFHISGQINLIWSFPEITPINFKVNRSSNPFVFVGNPRGDNYEKTNYKNPKPLIYFSFGTVVMNNLWNQQKDIRVKLSQFLNVLANLLKDRNLQVIFVSQGKNVLDIIPDNWWIYDNVDQVEILSRADLFITHGGSNGFHEAIMQKVPMIVVPFFGDQILVANRVEELGFGIKAGGSGSIDTHESKEFLNDKLAKDIVKDIDSILSSDDYAKRYLFLNLKAYSIKSLILGEIDARDGDLVAGKKYEIARLPADQNKKVQQSLEIFIGEESSKKRIEEKRIDFFAALFRVHVLLEQGKRLPAEVVHVLDDDEYFNDGVQFYRSIQDTWIPVDFEEVRRQFGIKKISQKNIVVEFEKVILASESPIKIEAVKQALGRSTMIGVNPQVSQDEQLVGMAEIVFATTERLTAIRNSNNEASLYISIVSGLIEGYHQFIDVGVVLMADKYGKTALAKSAGLALPLSATQRAMIRGLGKFTVGKILGEDTGNHKYDTDPHSLITQGKLNRSGLLKIAIEKALRHLS